MPKILLFQALLQMLELFADDNIWKKHPAKAGFALWDVAYLISNTLHCG